MKHPVRAIFGITLLAGLLIVLASSSLVRAPIHRAFFNTYPVAEGPKSITSPAMPATAGSGASTTGQAGWSWLSDQSGQACGYPTLFSRVKTPQSVDHSLFTILQEPPHTLWISSHVSTVIL